MPPASSSRSTSPRHFAQTCDKARDDLDARTTTTSDFWTSRQTTDKNSQSNNVPDRVSSLPGPGGAHRAGTAAILEALRRWVALLAALFVILYLLATM
mmetsp:Transcript_38105/g.122342  ORF Transcript_38105/g.122342 Transcript_38105/m.122342 type:complete len:98 (-) Transcript_38105:32-325(-)